MRRAVDDPRDFGILGQRHRGRDVVGQIAEHRRPVQRVGQRDDGIFLIIFDDDQTGRILGDIAAVGDDDRHQIADIGDPIDRHRRHGARRRRLDEVTAAQIEVERLQVAAGVDRPHPGKRPRLFDVDRQDRAARHGAAHEGGVEQPGHDHIVDEGPLAGEQPRVFLARQPLADEPRAGEHRVAHA